MHLVHHKSKTLKYSDSDVKDVDMVLKWRERTNSTLQTLPYHYMCAKIGYSLQTFLCYTQCERKLELRQVASIISGICILEDQYQFYSFTFKLHRYHTLGLWNKSDESDAQMMTHVMHALKMTVQSTSITKTGWSSVVLVKIYKRCEQR